jgi:hypothetical protein
MRARGGRRRKLGKFTDMKAKMAALRAMRGKSLAAPYGGRRRRRSRKQITPLVV